MERYLRKILTIGESRAIVLPKAICDKLGTNYVWLSQKEGKILIEPAKIDRS